MTSHKVALVGRRLEDNENLGLGYLMAALRRAKISTRRYELNRAEQIAPIADEVLGANVDVVGLSLSDGGSAYLFLALGELLERRGYGGHVTAGGPFATLAREWLLGRYRWLDSVVRFAGELPLRALAEALERGLPLTQVPGLTTREGDGPPAPVLDEPTLGLVPVREQRPTLLGHGVAHLMATRGCAGRCAYCGPAALQSLELGEARRLGARPARIRALGVGHVRRRALPELCDEIADLWRGGVRYFYFVDEHLLPYEEDQALDYLAKLGRGLGRRRVGALGIGCMLRAERLTAPVIQAFAQVGLVRAYVGVEFASAEEGRRYGRRVAPEHGRSMLRALSDAGVAAVTNLMLVHPETTEQTIEQGIDYLERVPGGVCETTRMMVYHGTRLWQKMQASGRLTGNPLRYGYTLGDPAAERFSRIFARLRGEAFYDHSLAYRTHDAYLTLALAHRLDSGRIPGDLALELESLRREVNALYARSYREALVMARAGCGRDESGLFVRRVALCSHRLSARLGRWEERVAVALGTPQKSFSPMRAAATSSLSLVLLGAACGGETQGDLPTNAAGGSGGVATGGTQRTSGGVAAGGIASASGGVATGGIRSTSGGVATGGIGTGGTSNTGGGSPTCTAEQVAKFEDDLRRALPANAAQCLYATISLYPGDPGSPYYSLEYWPDLGSGRVLASCDLTAPHPYESEFEQALASVSIPACETYPDRAVLHGAAEGESATILDRTEGCGGYTARIVIDSAGNVVDVVPYDSSAPALATAECMKSALAGLTFPCLAGTEVCPEYVIVE
jgi:radical SAM superfamily enzyme YgiQ (UPF0313 family)